MLLGSCMPESTVPGFGVDVVYKSVLLFDDIRVISWSVGSSPAVVYVHGPTGEHRLRWSVVAILL